MKVTRVSYNAFNALSALLYEQRHHPDVPARVERYTSASGSWTGYAVLCGGATRFDIRDPHFSSVYSAAEYSGTITEMTEADLRPEAQALWDHEKATKWAFRNTENGKYFWLRALDNGLETDPWPHEAKA